MVRKPKKEEFAEPENQSVHTAIDRIQDLPISKLLPYEGQPFKPYSADKLQELAEDIRAHGVLEPIIVRPYVGRFQILAGHNRTNAAKLAGLEEVPCIVKEDCDNDMAKLIMLNTNLNQREELTYSEKAFAYKMQLDTIKKTGATACRTSAELEAQTGENKRNIQRYIRLTYLIKPLLDMVDAKHIPFIAGVNLSYLKDSEQTTLVEYINMRGISVSVEQSADLKYFSTESSDGVGYIVLDVVFGTHSDKAQSDNSEKVKKKAFKINYDKLSPFIRPDASPPDIEAHILEALQFFEEHYKESPRGVPMS